MKKIICTLLMLSMLSGCITVSSTNSDVYKGKVPSGQVELKCPKCNEKDVSEYFVNNPNANYEIKLETSKSLFQSNDFSTFLYVLSLGIIPGYIGKYEFVVGGELFDKKAGKSISLGKVETQTSSWSSWLLLPVMPFCATWDDSEQELAEEEAGKELLKRAAMAIYEPTNPILTDKWHCSEYTCRFGEIMAQKSTSAEDVLWVAKNTHSFDDFQKARGKLKKALTTPENCTATRHILENGLISKSTQRYWTLIDFWKDNCHETEGFFGMTKDQLLSLKGIPSKGYKVNADTEVVSYSSLSRDGESVITTIYTLDRGIVTNIK